MLRVLFHFNKYITFNIPRGVAHITFQILFVISDAILAKTLLPIAYLYPLPGLPLDIPAYCILFFCHFWVKTEDRSSRFRTYIFHPCRFVLAFSILAFSVAPYKYRYPPPSQRPWYRVQQKKLAGYIDSQLVLKSLVRERSALATIIISRRVVM